MKLKSTILQTSCLLALLGVMGCTTDKVRSNHEGPANLSDAEMENLVRRSYQYVAMFNVNSKGALDESNPMSTHGYNKVHSSTALLDHRIRVIARPNNDTLYTVGMVDVTKEPIVMKIPAFDSTYVSLMVTGYDHYVNIPVSTSMGADAFAKPTTILFYSERTKL